MFIRLITKIIFVFILGLINAVQLPAIEKVITPNCLYILDEDEENKKITFPSSIFFDNVKNEIYLVESGHSRILIFTSDFFPLYAIDKDDGIIAPTCVAVDPAGNIFAGQSSSQKKSSRISVFNPCLKWKHDIFLEGFEGSDKFIPKNIALDDEGNIFISGSNYKGIIIFNNKGKYSYSFVPEKIYICDVEIDGNGNLYLLSEDKGSIYIYNKKREFIGKFGEKGGGGGKLSRPRGISVDLAKKRIYVVDYMRHAVNVYDLNGNYLFEFGGKGWAKGWFQFPTDICVDNKGNVLITDTFNNRVQILEIK